MRWRSSEHYRQRARELRDAAQHMNDDIARMTVLDLAEQYDAMAERHRKPDGDGKDMGDGADSGHARH